MPKEIKWGNIEIKGLEDNDLSKYSLKSLIAVENAKNSAHIISQKAKERWGDDEKRFWENVDKKSNSECWITKKCSILLKDGRRITYQRFSLEIHKRFSNKEVVGHKCNNKKCVNPNHLYYADRAEHASITPKGDKKGENNGRAKLNNSKILKIKKEFDSLVKKNGKRYGVATILSKKYNVSSATIGHIVNGKTWK